jgi:FKBP-type peptidyl-prolyl cis-trans isomerase (trigger factor)
MSKYNTTIKKNDDSTVEITAEIPAQEFEAQRKDAIKKLGKDVTIPGFRKGNVPEKVLLEKVGEQSVLHEMAEMALSVAYPQVLAEEKIDAISQPEIQITKIAAGNPLGFSAKTTIMPEVKLPDYKKIAGEVNKKGTNEPEVTDREFDEAMLRVRKSLASKDTPPEEMAKMKDEDLPELTDEKVKELGDYKNVDDFKEKVRQSQLEEKKRQAKEKKRMEIIDAILKDSKIPTPDILIEAELNRMIAQFKGDIERMGMKTDEYLKQVGKNEEDMKKEWRPDAEKRVKTEL